MVSLNLTLLVKLRESLTRYSRVLEIQRRGDEELGKEVGGKRRGEKKIGSEEKCLGWGWRSRHSQFV